MFVGTTGELVIIVTSKGSWGKLTNYTTVYEHCVNLINYFQEHVLPLSRNTMVVIQQLGEKHGTQNMHGRVLGKHRCPT